MRRRAAKMLDHLGLSDVELSVALVDDATIHDLNRHYRRRNRPTDVLSFSMTEGEPPPVVAGVPELLGDVVISVPTARRQARKRRRPLLEELTTLLAHGLLHLLGHDHRTAAQHRAMEALRVELETAARTRRAVAG